MQLTGEQPTKLGPALRWSRPDRTKNIYRFSKKVENTRASSARRRRVGPAGPRGSRPAPLDEELQAVALLHQRVHIGSQHSLVLLGVRGAS